MHCFLIGDFIYNILYVDVTMLALTYLFFNITSHLFTMFFEVCGIYENESEI